MSRLTKLMAVAQMPFPPPPLTGPKKEEEEEYFHNKTDRQDGGIIRASDTQETAGGPALQGEKNLFRGRKMVLLLPSFRDHNA